MKLTKCIDCGRLFKDEKGIKLCSKCIEKVKIIKPTIDSEQIRTKEQKIRECVYDNPNIIPTELITKMQSKGIKVKYSEILKLINDGKLALVNRVEF